MNTKGQTLGSTVSLQQYFLLFFHSLVVFDSQKLI